MRAFGTAQIYALLDLNLTSILFEMQHSVLYTVYLKYIDQVNICAPLFGTSPDIKAGHFVLSAQLCISSRNGDFYEKNRNFGFIHGYTV